MAESFSRETINELKKKLQLSFDGSIGAYYKSVRKSGEKKLHENAEVVWEKRCNKDTQKIEFEPHLTGRRWLQFLDNVQEITRSSDLWTEGGKLDVVKLAEQYGLDVQPFTVEYLAKVSRKLLYRKVFKEAQKEGRVIDGFSFPRKRKIFFNPTVSPARQRFAIMHELSHFLLGHNGFAFCKVSGAPDSGHEHKEYNEEADKLTAIVLIPHDYVKENPDKPDKEIAERFGVPKHAVAKRRKEVNTELYILRYGVAANTVHASIS